jgi:hypothetical protein
MNPDALIADLDVALSEAGSEEIILRRIAGTASNQVNIDVTCIAKVVVIDTERGPGGVAITHYDVIISPTQINQAQWPGSTISAVSPFNLDQSIPRAGPTDKILMRGLPPCEINMVDPVKVGGEVVRINMKATGTS